MEERFETFTVLIDRISRNIRKIKRQEMEAYQLKGVHASCLYYLYTAGSMTAAALCEHCEEDKSAISRALRELEGKGYLAGRSSREKKYKVPLVLTREGREVGERIAQRISAVLKDVEALLTEEERGSFYRSLDAISRAIQSLAASR